MPIPFSPYRFTCISCGWTQRYVPNSDVINQSDMPKHCPECGSQGLKFKLEPNPYRFLKQDTPPLLPFGLVRELFKLLKK